MNKFISIFALSALVIFSFGQAVHAEDGRRGEMGSSTMPGKAFIPPHASSTDMGRSQQPPMGSGMPGMVSAISASSFSITAPGFNSRKATTTLTVNVASTTKFYKASTTAAFADLSVGSRVIVMGRVSTSTLSVTANVVLIVPANMTEGKMMREGSTTDAMHGPASSTPGFFRRMQHFFFGPRGRSDEGSTTPAGGPAAAGESRGFFGRLFGAVFGWDN